MNYYIKKYNKYKFKYNYIKKYGGVFNNDIEIIIDIVLLSGETIRFKKDEFILDNIRKISEQNNYFFKLYNNSIIIYDDEESLDNNKNSIDEFKTTLQNYNIITLLKIPMNDIIFIPKNNKDNPYITFKYDQFRQNLSVSNTSIDIRFINLFNLFTIKDPYFNECTIIRINFLSNYTELIQIIFPPNIKEIHDNVLTNCSKLYMVDLSKLINLKKIGNYFLYNCKSLKILKLPQSIETIPGKFLLNCIALKRLELPQSIKYIQSNFLNECISLETLKLPQSIEKIEDYFLCDCKALKTLELPQSIKKIGDYFLNNCTELKTLELPQSIEDIGEYFLNNCTELEILDLSKLYQLKYIDTSILQDCNKLKKLLLPPNLINIYNNSIKFLEKTNYIEEITYSNTLPLKLQIIIKEYKNINEIPCNFIVLS